MQRHWRFGDMRGLGTWVICRRGDTSDVGTLGTQDWQPGACHRPSPTFPNHVGVRCACKDQSSPVTLAPMGAASPWAHGTAGYHWAEVWCTHDTGGPAGCRVGWHNAGALGTSSCCRHGPCAAVALPCLRPLLSPALPVSPRPQGWHRTQSSETQDSAPSLYSPGPERGMGETRWHRGDVGTGGVGKKMMWAGGQRGHSYGAQRWHSVGMGVVWALSARW